MKAYLYKLEQGEARICYGFWYLAVGDKANADFLQYMNCSYDDICRGVVGHHNSGNVSRLRGHSFSLLNEVKIPQEVSGAVKVKCESSASMVGIDTITTFIVVKEKEVENLEIKNKSTFNYVDCPCLDPNQAFWLLDWVNKKTNDSFYLAYRSRSGWDVIVSPETPTTKKTERVYLGD